MSHLSISAQSFRTHLLELRSSPDTDYNKLRKTKNNTIPFGLLGDIWATPNIMPVSIENRYYPDRNMWVVCIIPLDRWFEVSKIDEIDTGFSYEQIIDFLANNLEKPVYVYSLNTFYPIYKTDVVKWNGLLGLFFQNHSKEIIEEDPLDDAIINKAKYCVSIDKYHTENGLGDSSEMDKEPELYYFSNLISAKLFYNKAVAKFMERTFNGCETNFSEFSQTSLAWHGWKAYRHEEFGQCSIAVDNIAINISSVNISYNKIEGEYDLI